MSGRQQTHPVHWTDWVLGIVAVLLAAWIISIGGKVDAHETRISKNEQSSDDQIKRLERIEDKIDKILENWHYAQPTP